MSRTDTILSHTYAAAAFLATGLLCSLPLWTSPCHAGEQYTSKQVMSVDTNLGESSGTSIQDLENSLAGMNNDYARSSTQRFLAHHYLENKEYDKAIRFYEDALAANGLSGYANLEMMQELIQVYLLKEDYKQVATTIRRFESLGGKPNAAIYLMRAHASYKMNDRTDTLTALDKAMAAPGLDTTQMNYALSLYYSLGNYQQSATLLEKILDAEPDNSENWQRLTSIYLKLNQPAKALDILSLAWEKQVPFRARDVALLSDLYANSGNWYRAASIYHDGIQRNLLQPDSKDYQRLYNYWFQAREKDRALAALEKAAALDRDTTLDLYLAQLYMDNDQWEKMQQVILKTCQNPLKDQYVSQANLLLGISQLKLGQREAARRSFINATVLGGASDTAGQYLQFMRAEPASDNEKRSVSGPCRSPSTTSIWSSSSTPDTRNRSSEPVATGRLEAPSLSGKPVSVKTTGAQTFFYGEYSLTMADFRSGVAGKAIQLGLAAAKSGGSISGPMVFMFDKPLDPKASRIDFKMAFPVTGNPAARGQFRIMREEGFHCSFTLYDGSPENLESAWKQLTEDTIAAGYHPDGQARQVVDPGNTVGAKTVKMELQLGIAP